MTGSLLIKYNVIPNRLVISVAAFLQIRLYSSLCMNTYVDTICWDSLQIVHSHSEQVEELKHHGHAIYRYQQLVLVSRLSDQPSAGGTVTIVVQQHFLL